MAIANFVLVTMNGCSCQNETNELNENDACDHLTHFDDDNIYLYYQLCNGDKAGGHFDEAATPTGVHRKATGVSPEAC